MTIAVTRTPGTATSVGTGQSWSNYQGGALAAADGLCALTRGLTDGDCARVATARLIVNGAETGNNRPNGRELVLGTTDTYTPPLSGAGYLPANMRFGGATYLWGLNLTPAIVNNSGFGFDLALGTGSTKMTNELRAYNFGFAIPAQAIIEGVLVEALTARYQSEVPNYIDLVYVDLLTITAHYSFGNGMQRLARRPRQMRATHAREEPWQ